MRSFVVPVKVQFEGELPPHLRLVNVKAQPSTVQLLLQPSDWHYISELHTLPVNLNEIWQTTMVRIPLLLPKQAQLPPGMSSIVQVTIQVAPVDNAHP
jgi:YbbR domain-containing protein